MGVYEAFLATLLGRLVGNFVDAHQLGRTLVEVLFDLGLTNSKERRPDVAFVSYGRWPRQRRVPRGRAWPVVPNLAVEIISPTNTADEVMTKLREYFKAGVQQVWVIYPVEEVAHVYEAFDRIRVVLRHEALDGGAILPGFRLPLSDLFEEEETEAAPPA